MVPWSGLSLPATPPAKVGSSCFRVTERSSASTGVTSAEAILAQVTLVLMV